MTDSSGFLSFSTDDLPHRDRVPMWREEFARGVVKMDVQTLGDEPFRSASRIRILPDLKIWSCVVTTSELRRTRSLAADGEDSLVLAIVRSGHGGVLQHGRDMFIGPGGAMLWSSEAAGVFRNPGTLDIVTLAFPRQSLARAVADVEAALLKPIPATAEALRLLMAYVDMLQGHALPMEPRLQALSSSHVYDLAALALGATRDAGHSARLGGLRAVRLAAIKADIMANLAKPGLSADGVALRHGISPRYVRALFEGEQTSFTDFVREQRLRRAYRMLGNALSSDRSVSAVAFDCGFGDLSYFNNSFRRRFGATPTDIRRLSSGSAPDDGEGSAGTGNDGTDADHKRR